MKRQLLVKLFSITGAVALLAGATFAHFTSNSVTIESVTLASATPSLQIHDSGGWGVQYDDLDIKESNMYPGWVGSDTDHTFFLRNVTGGSVPFGSIIANLPSSTAGNWDALKDVVQMRFGETGKGWSTTWYTLKEWHTGSADILLSELADGTQREFTVQFQMPSGDDTAKGKTLTFTLSFVAQTP